MKLRRLTGKSGTDAERGELILKASSEIRNHGAFVVEDVIEDLLRSGAWRTYTFPDGTHHEWLDREFDYFVSAQQLEWEKIRRAITKPEVLIMIADQSAATGTASEGRRALDEVRGQFPHLELVDLVNSHMRTVAKDKPRRKAYLSSGKIEQARTGGRWEFRLARRTDDLNEKAGAIVAKLDEDPELRKRVFQLLDAENSRRRYRKNGSAKPKGKKASALQ